ncbi:uncharacterized protein PV09_02446 [Verruconis gallopava]|uniref:Glutaredoxin-like protein n=1 Tax=Verruconis gallopava TaxID=253628 RepID=A0A0D1XVB6_9PEZI|nr:uncharacterized protein PV09_02446 [Verruconis gallopava]KIW06756.1 hypothetical protein PV09_02446 [Verruconis gallopava]
MKPSMRLLNTCRVTLFTRPNCSLCDDAKVVLSKVWDVRPFDYQEINVMAPGQEEWKNVYEFDTPVVHVDKAFRCQTTTFSLKTMHKIMPDQIHQLMDKVEKGGS